LGDDKRSIEENIKRIEESIIRISIEIKIRISELNRNSFRIRYEIKRDREDDNIR